MDFTEIYNIIVSNPIYIAVSTLLIVLLIYSVIKKFVKILFVTLFCILLYIGFLYYTGDEKVVQDLNKVRDQVIDNSKEALEVLDKASEEFKSKK
tara:strand:- start:4633 stop:4917 length:285 start_codon:yes stop_codon:yes gene_type:complete